MSRTRSIRTFPLVWATLLASFLTWRPAAAQKVVTQDAGAGRKQELVYDASGKIVETRTLNADGTLQVRNLLDYKPGFYAPQRRDISYWPGGKAVKQISEATYDENSNFTGELIEVYDREGRHTGGHKLTHNPWSGIYRCANWDGAAQKYVSVACPSGEESGKPPEHLQRLSYQQASELLERARRTGAAELKSQSVNPARSAQPVTTGDTTPGVVLPSELVSGEYVSGSVVPDLSRYEDVPGLTLVRLALPAESSGAKRNLRDWEIEITGSQPQPADAPFSFQVPRGTAELTLTLHRRSDPAKSASQTVPVASTAPMQGPADEFQAPSLVVKGTVSQVAGRFSGDSTHTFAAVDSQPATIVAETQRAAYIEIPDEIAEGSHSLILSDSPTLAAISVVVAEVSFQPEPHALEAGQSQLIIARFSGAEQLPDESWRAGIFPPASLEQARKLAPQFVPPEAEHHAGSETSDPKAVAQDTEEREDKEREDKDGGSASVEPAGHGDPGGKILLVLKNTAPENVSFRASSNQSFAFTLVPDSFEQGEFVYKFVVQSLRAGDFSVRSVVIPFLAPSTARPLTPR